MIDIARKAEKKKYYLKDFSLHLSTKENLSSKTVKAYEHDINTFLKFVTPYFKEGLSFSNIDEKIIMDYFHHLTSKRNYSDSSLNRKLASLKRYFKYLKIEGYLSDSPVTEIASIQLPKRVPKTFEREQFERLLENIEKKPETSIHSIYIKKRDRAIMELLYATGLKVSELVNLTVPQIDFNNKILKIVGKGNKERIIFINEIALDALKEYVAVKSLHRKELFVSQKGCKMTVRAIQHLFDKYAKKAGLDCITAHTIRNSFATHLLEGGGDLFSIKKLLGHSSLTSTEIYLKASQKKREEIYKFAHPRMKGSLQKSDSEIGFKGEGKQERYRLSRIKIPLKFLKYRPSRRKIDDTISFYKKYSRFVKPLIVNRNNRNLADGYECYIAAKELGLVGIDVKFIN